MIKDRRRIVVCMSSRMKKIRKRENERVAEAHNFITIYVLCVCGWRKKSLEFVGYIRHKTFHIYIKEEIYVMCISSRSLAHFHFQWASGGVEKKEWKRKRIFMPLGIADKNPSTKGIPQPMERRRKKKKNESFFVCVCSSQTYVVDEKKAHGMGNIKLYVLCYLEEILAAYFSFYYFNFWWGLRELAHWLDLSCPPWCWC